MNLSALVSPWLCTIRAVLAGAVGMAVLAGALLIVGPALPGHVVAPWWVSAQPHIQAVGPVIPPPCLIAAHRYRHEPDYVPPPKCLNSKFFRDLQPSSEVSPPPGDALPSLGDAP
jgi:hypothetical protein